MSESLLKQEVLKLIEQGLAEAEAAISDHPTKTVELYKKGKCAFEEGAEPAEDSEWSKSLGLSVSDLLLINHYLLAMAFISAWWHLQGDKERRDRAAQSASFLVGGIEGLHPEDVIKRLVQYEQAWRGVLSSESSTQQDPVGCGVLIAIGLAVIARLVF